MAFNFKSNLKYYLKKIKNENTLLKSIDISQNKLEDEGIMYLSFGFKLCMHLNSLVKYCQ